MSKTITIYGVDIDLEGTRGDIEKGISELCDKCSKNLGTFNYALRQRIGYDISNEGYYYSICKNNDEGKYKNIVETLNHGIIDVHTICNDTYHQNFKKDIKFDTDMLLNRIELDIDFIVNNSIDITIFDKTITADDVRYAIMCNNITTYTPADLYRYSDDYCNVSVCIQGQFNDNKPILDILIENKNLITEEHYDFD